MKPLIVAILLIFTLLFTIAAIEIRERISLERRLAAQEAEIDTLKKEWTAWRSRAFLHEKYFTESVNGKYEQQNQRK